MNSTPQSNRLHVGIFGETNVGKSTLFNALTETDIAIVSDLPGTTTDPVQKAMELLPFGPIVLIDTAGLGDETPLGRQRIEKTLKLLDRIDFAIYVTVRSSDTSYNENYKKFASMLDEKNIPHILVTRDVDINEIKKTMVERLSDIKSTNKDGTDTLLGGLLPPGATVLMVCPVDTEAPKGRLVLPQNQLIRDCIDNGFMAYVITENEIEQALSNLRKVDLVVTDSKVFGLVAKVVPPDIKLTSFSILMARQKGDIEVLLKGLEAVESFKKNGGKVLISEVCTHNRTHEDIGRVKIPALLRKLNGYEVDFDFTVGHDYPDDLSEYDLIIHCGACMITPREMKNRISAAEATGVPITNYGLFLAHTAGILDRSIEVLR